MSRLYSDGTLTTADASGPPIEECPFPETNTAYIVRQVFVVARGSFSLTALGTAYPSALDTLQGTGYNAAGFILVAEGPRQGAGADMVQWERTYAKVPATRRLANTAGYKMINYYQGSANTPRITAQQNYPATLQYDYFLMDKTTGKVFNSAGTDVTIGTPSAGTLPQVSQIPANYATKYYGGYTNAFTANIITDTIGYDSEIVFDYTGGKCQDDYPTRDAYEFWIAYNAHIISGAASPTAPTPIRNSTPAGGKLLFELTVQDSSLQMWLGTIVERQTIYLPPQ